ncbi:hypothetical protein N7523_001372 [Penicillium sp. IBT 18751x]|nr:hypothetical protein N7523_001372 [Penicillium sp. IBT 18751x]
MHATNERPSALVLKHAGSLGWLFPHSQELPRSVMNGAAGFPIGPNYPPKQEPGPESGGCDLGIVAR